MHHSQLDILLYKLDHASSKVVLCYFRIIATDGALNTPFAETDYNVGSSY